MKLVAFLNDTEESVRFAALKLLMTGQYKAPYSAWSPLVSAETFMDRTFGEKRAVFQAMRATSSDEVIPFFESLITERSWTNRKKKEELAALAAEALGKLPSSAALIVLELGQKERWRRRQASLYRGTRPSPTTAAAQAGCIIVRSLCRE